MRKWMLWIHMYGLLLCAPYLILFGVSSLMFNHPLSFTSPEPTVVHWERAVRAEPLADTKQQAQAYANQLGLFGWVIPWQTKRTPDGGLRFGLSRLGKEYIVQVPAAGVTAQVEEKRSGVWPILRHLHGLMGIPGSTPALFWKQYTRFCTILVLFAGVSGVYLFAVKKRERLLGWSLLAGATLVSGAMMAYITFAG